MTEFGERLRRMRAAAGLSQKELAGGSLTTGYISLLENGKRQPSPEVLHHLASRLGCSPTQLMSGEPSERDQRIELERDYARLAIEHGEPAEARARLERLLAEESIPARIRDDLVLLLGMACERSGDLPAAVIQFQDLFERAMVRQTSVPLTVVGIGLLRCYLDSGALHQAATIGERVLATAGTQGLVGTDDYYRVAATVMQAYIGLGDFLHARAWGERYLAESRRHDCPAGQAAMYWNAAELAEHEGRLDDALALCERALGIVGELGTVRDTPRLQLEMAWLLLLDPEPQLERSVELLEHCAEALNDLGSRVDRGRWHWLRARTLLYAGDPLAAEQRARHALGLLADGGGVEQAEAHITLADALAGQQRAESVDELLAASAVLRRWPSTRATALVWREIGERLVAAGRSADAMDAFGRALDGAGVRYRPAPPRFSAALPQPAATGSGEAPESS